MPDVVTANDYYPFGMAMPGRTYSNSLLGYRYGFGSQERSTEINENSYTAEYWQYDARIGRRWNIDPVVKDDESPYMVLGNNPIVMVDPNGADWYKNKKTGDIEYRGKWHGKHKGYESLGKGNGDWLHYEGKDYNKKTGDVITTLESVTVTAKAKKHGTNWLNWPSYTKADVARWNDQRWTVWQRLDANQSATQEGDDPELVANSASYQRQWQAEKDWRAMNYAILDFATVWVPVPKVGMVRWLKPFGNTAGRIFWSGGGTAGKAFASATEHALLNGGTTLEMTTAGKVLTWVTTKTGENMMTGKLWSFASRQFARGASGEIHMFMDLSKVNPTGFWFKQELPILTSKGLDIITHIK